MKSCVRLVPAMLVAISLAGCASSSRTASNSSIEQLTFATPQDAVAALANYAESGDKAYGRAIFGPEVSELSSGDAAVDRYERQLFVQAILRKHELRVIDEDEQEILIGINSVAFPVPLANVNGRWMFDTPAGLDRLVDMRVGNHELRTIEALRAIAVAQQEYRSVDRDNDGVLEFAPRILSAAGQRNGLYWETAANEPNSPLGAFYTQGEVPNSGTLGYNGYFFKVLTAQGGNASGGAKSFADSANNLTAGFAILAYPAIYGETAIMTFQMGPDGVVYQRDLGADATATAGTTINRFNPDQGWAVTND